MPLTNLKEKIYIDWASVTGKRPLENYPDAKELASAIEKYYHRQGYTWVKVYLIKERTPITHWAIRSNIRFKEYGE